jgi:hypothetical protein
MEKPDNKTFSPFQVIALNNIKDKKTSKEGSLNDLFKCIAELNSSTQSLGDFMVGAADPVQAEELKRYLDALVKVQTGLLEMAKVKITNVGMASLGQAQAAPAPAPAAESQAEG